VHAQLTITIATLTALLTAAIPGYAQAPAGGGRGGRGRGANAAAAASIPHDPRDLSGVWTKTWRTLALSQTPPMFTPLGKQLFDANKPSYGPRLVPPAVGNDPAGNCDPLGLVRNLVLEVSIYPTEIVQTPNRVFQFFEWGHSYREIWTDGRQLPKEADPTFNGISVGRWDGNTFVVTSGFFDDRFWLDHFGTPHSDEMTLEERYRRIDRDTLELTMTLTDPKVFAAPWVGEAKIMKLAPRGREIVEQFCVPSQEMEFNRIVRDPAGGVVR
jgi:hypothetical protein